MTFQTINVGKKGENLAVAFLLNNHFFIKNRNYRTKFGEIDIIAHKNGTYYFIEVKTRIGISKGKPYEAVDSRKLRHLKYACELYVLKNKLKNDKLALMVVSIILTKELTVESIKRFDIEE